MKITFSFTDTPNISSLKRSNIFNSHFKLPDEAEQLSDCKDRVIAIATLVGKLTWACLHVTCYEVGLKEYPIKTSKTENRNVTSISTCMPLLMRFDEVRESAYRRKPPYIGLKIIANIHTQPSPISEEQKALSTILKLIGEHCVYLLNANPDPTIRWQFTSYITRYYDNAAIKRFNKQQRKVQSIEKRQRKEAESAATGESKPSPKTGAGRRIGAVPGIFKGVQFRSQLEIRFVTQLESKGIKWIYESERLGEGNYLVDFYLPDLKCWVEVKGKPEPRDDYLLKEVAAYLAHERQERLYVYSQGKCLAVSEDRFQELKQPEFWILLKQT